MSDIPPWGVGPAWPGYRYLKTPRKPAPEELVTNSSKRYNLRFQHKHKPGRYYYLDSNLCLTQHPEHTKAMSYTAGRIALDHALALAGLLATDAAANVTAELVETLDSNP